MQEEARAFVTLLKNIEIVCETENLHEFFCKRANVIRFLS